MRESCIDHISVCTVRSSFAYQDPVSHNTSSQSRQKRLEYRTVMSGSLPPPATAGREHPSALQTAKRNAAYLIDPTKSAAPDRRRTRALLKTGRYIIIFLFWRLVRYAKYAAVGAVTAAIAGTAIGSFASGVGFILAPPGILAGAGVGLVWGLGKFGWRTLARRVRSGDVERADARGDEHKDGSGEKEVEVVPRLEPGGARVDVW